MSKRRPTPLDRLKKAAREAQDFLCAQHFNATASEWDNADAMQVYEDLESSLQDLEAKGGAA